MAFASPVSHRKVVPDDDQPGVHTPVILREEPEPLITEAVSELDKAEPGFKVENVVAFSGKDDLTCEQNLDAQHL